MRNDFKDNLGKIVTTFVLAAVASSICSAITLAVASNRLGDPTNAIMTAAIASLMVGFPVYHFWNRWFAIGAVFVSAYGIASLAWSHYRYLSDNDTALRILTVGPLYFGIVIGVGISLGRTSYLLVRLFR
jgi:hypothetical protein